MRRNEKKQRRKLLSRVMAMAAAITLTAVSVGTAMPVQAANIPPKDNLTTTFNKYLVMDENANVPNATFEFTIASGQAVTATDSSPAIYAGIGTPMVEKAVFQADDDTTEGKPSDTTGSTTENFKYATDEVTVNFDKVSFTAPGIYRYTITEITPTQDGITIEGNNTRTLDVYVEYKESSNQELEVKHYVLHDDTGNPNTATKSNGFTNTYTTYDLTLEKQVTGNQGDREKYFEFTVDIANALAGTVYDVDLTDATWNSAPSNPEKLTVGSNGTISGTFYLKDDESIVIQGLTADTNYTITETAYTSDGYETSYVIDSSDETEALSTGKQNMGADDHKVTFTNDKEGTVPTGIILETAPYIVLAAVVLAGLAVLFVTRRRRAR